MRSIIVVGCIALGLTPFVARADAQDGQNDACTLEREATREYEGRRPSRASLEALETLLACQEDQRSLEFVGLLPEVQGFTRAAGAASEVRDTHRQIVTERRFLEFAGVSWGAGLVRSPGRRITKAVVDSNGVVRATEILEGEVRPVAVLTRFFGKDKNAPGGRKFGVGPMIVASPGVGSDKIPTSLGVGLMLGLRTNKRGSAVGVGLAYVVDANVKALHGDFRDGEAAPVDERRNPLQPQYVSQTTGSWMVTVAYSPAKPRRVAER